MLLLAWCSRHDVEFARLTSGIHFFGLGKVIKFLNPRESSKFVLDL